MYRVREIFETFQGEGARAGEQSTFVRFSGCNLWSGLPDKRDKGKGSCATWCDTDFASGKVYTLTDLLIEMRTVLLRQYGRWPRDSEKKPWCVLTGGEPALQIDKKLISNLHKDGWMVSVETNGSISNPAIDDIDWVTVSPKLNKDGTVPSIAVKRGSELKVILPGFSDPSCGWSDSRLSNLERITDFEHYFVQPQDPIDPNLLNVSYLVGSLASKKQTYSNNQDLCASFVHRNPAWSVSLQTHKMRGIR